MKINSYPSISQITHRSAEKAGGVANEKQGGAGQNAYQQNQKKKDQDSSEFEKHVSEAKVQEAIHSFADDDKNKGLGITAAQEGSGPGLRVVLKDNQGGILRNISGEEFLKLKEAASSGNKSGRLLDQKI